MSERPQMVLAGNTAGRERAGGHAWALAQWALGLRAAGVRTTVAPPLGDALTPITHFEAPHDASGAGILNAMGFLSRDALDADGPWVFLDLDPGYPQMWRELGLADLLAGHDRFVTLGANVGREGCAIPDCGVEWIATPPPVDLAAWTPTPACPRGRAFTSVATWRNPYGTVAFDGIAYGSRVHEFRQFLELPRLVDAEFELALDIDAAETRDLAALEANGWRLVDPQQAAGTPQAYRDYIRGSRAEICIAQQMYVATRSGWLSDRSVCYLASGKPVLAQDTGLADHYPVGEGLLTFSTLEEAAAGVEEIERNYERHSAAARALAEDCFDARKVLGRLLERLALPVGAAA
ncbi:MAG TPA: hypothetical protein VKB03_04180 [Conexibacter sp.]|nr:hypothetical protein [Conexibacter sp.]